MHLVRLLMCHSQQKALLLRELKELLIDHIATPVFLLPSFFYDHSMFFLMFVVHFQPLVQPRL